MKTYEKILALSVPRKNLKNNLGNKFDIPLIPCHILGEKKLKSIVLSVAEKYYHILAEKTLEKASTSWKKVLTLTMYWGKAMMA